MTLEIDITGIVTDRIQPIITLSTHVTALGNLLRSQAKQLNHLTETDNQTAIFPDGSPASFCVKTDSAELNMTITRTD